MTTTTATDTSTAGIDDVEAWRPFHVRVSAVRQLSPAFRRITFTGDDLHEMAHDGPDQRIKVYIPGRDETIPDMSPAELYEYYRQGRARGALRTYTIVAVRPEHREVDVDFAVHGETGPATTWATHARIGDEAILVGPNRRFGADCQGHEWRPPHSAKSIVLAGDETAVPAIAGILRTLHTWRRLPRVQVFLEVPEPSDILDLTPPQGVEVQWLVRRPAPESAAASNGDLLVEAVRLADLDPQAAAADADAVDTVDIDLDLLWEVAEGVTDDSRFYAWVAGEAGAVKAIRRYFVRERGIDRRCVSFMGYWRLGRAEQ